MKAPAARLGAGVAHGSPRAGPAAEVALCLTTGADRTVLAVCGRLDALTTRGLCALLEVVADPPAGHHVVVDLAEMTIVEEAVVDDLVRALARFSAFSGAVTIVSSSPMTQGLLDRARLAADSIEVAPITPVPGPPVLSMLPPLPLHAPAAVHATAAVDAFVTTSLRAIVDLAVRTLDVADGASMSIAVGDGLVTVAASDGVIAGMDADQYSLGQGPCVSAATSGEGFSIESMSSETRWPEFAARAYERGINSVISTPLLFDDRVLGALNIYSRRPRAFALAQGEFAWALAKRAAAVLSRDAADGTRTVSDP